ncbi:helix-turn-helix transcriptional regulator [Candidimonas nitroreducens]|uniref:helix-turn-helix transcriptional regulator n=1 Tax=Candidimonas nitroreducens TaxID=683354 RepID=UPI001303D5EB|nr:helix-turn-helix transcriptional regulator [Candidimonas nitroreducens]
MRVPDEPIVLDTRDIVSAKRFQFWRDFIARRLMAMAMWSTHQPDYIGRVEIHGLDNACMVFASGDSCGASRGVQEIACNTGEMPAWLLMRTNVATHIEHGGRHSDLKPGDLIIIDTRRPYARADSPVDFTILAMPDFLLHDWRMVFDAYAGHCFPSEREWAKPLSGLLAGVSPPLMRSISGHPVLRTMFTKNLVFMLVQMLLHESADFDREFETGTRSEQARINLYNLMLLWIRDHHDDPQLTVTHVAQAFGVSPRYVHKLFATYSEGRKFLAFLQKTRLEHAVQLLIGKADAGSSISDISWRCGFADTSTFGRLFKRNYGVTPGAYRAQQLNADLQSSDAQ